MFLLLVIFSRSVWNIFLRPKISISYDLEWMDDPNREYILSFGIKKFTTSVD